MRRFSLVFAMIVLLVGIPVQAQKIQPRPIVGPAAVTIQGENGEGYMVFNLNTGEFTCFLCEYGYAMSGKGEVKIDGCSIYFATLTDEYNIFITINKCEQQAKVAVEYYPKDNRFDIQPVYESWFDLNLLDSKADCAVPPEK
jgi:hypothetical protein